MEIRSVSVGVVAIKSVSTGLYLAMSKKGTLFGSVSIQPRNSVSGKVVNMGGGAVGGRWRESRLKVFTLKIIWTTQTDWPWSPQDEVALEESWARKSRKGQSVIINHGWNTWATIPAAPVGLFNCQNRYQGRRHPTSSYKEPAGPLLKVFACHLRRSSFTQRAGLLLFNTSTR